MHTTETTLYADVTRASDGVQVDLVYTPTLARPEGASLVLIHGGKIVDTLTFPFTGEGAVEPWRVLDAFVHPALYSETLRDALNVRPSLDQGDEGEPEGATHAGVSTAEDGA